MADNSSGIHLVNFTIRNLTRGQAEGLLMMGEQNIVSQVSNIKTSDAGRYSVTVSNRSGRATGNAESLAVK